MPRCSIRNKNWDEEFNVAVESMGRAPRFLRREGPVGSTVYWAAMHSYEHGFPVNLPTNTRVVNFRKGYSDSGVSHSVIEKPFALKLYQTFAENDSWYLPFNLIFSGRL